VGILVSPPWELKWHCGGRCPHRFVQETSFLVGAVCKQTAEEELFIARCKRRNCVDEAAVWRAVGELKA